ncbi:MAG: hypothetical protein LBI72_13510 [Flavobacteriaceae bacterium]|jgi:hypothetical protein|nr:hypothetical protein [Flavobacteriaceae bacterium]
MEKDKITLFKIRNFGEYLNDTFSFLKTEGKLFFTNFMKLSGGYFILLILLTYILFDLFYESTVSGTTDNVDQFINNNFGITILLVLAVACIAIFVAIHIFTFPVIYLNNMINQPENNKDTKALNKQIKSNVKRGISFFLLTILLVGPLVVIAFSLSAVLIFLIIGLPLLLLIGPFSTSVVAIAYYDYVIQKSGFFDAYKQAFKLIKVDFWGILGNSFILMFIMQTLGYIATMLPNMLYYVGLFTSTLSEYEMQQLGYYKVVVAIMLIVGSIISYLMYTVLLVNQGLVYYSSREYLESYQSMLDIETIGQNNE